MWPAVLVREVLRADLVLRRQHDQALDQVAQLTDVPLPPVADQLAHHLGAEAHVLAPVLRADALQEVRRQQCHVALALAQRRDL